MYLRYQIIKQGKINYPDTELVILGIVVKSFATFDLELSQSIQWKIPKILGIVLHEIKLDKKN